MQDCHRPQGPNTLVAMPQVSRLPQKQDASPSFHRPGLPPLHEPFQQRTRTDNPELPNRAQQRWDWVTDVLRAHQVRKQTDRQERRGEGSTTGPLTSPRLSGLPTHNPKESQQVRGGAHMLPEFLLAPPGFPLRYGHPPSPPPPLQLPKVSDIGNL